MFNADSETQLIELQRAGAEEKLRELRPGLPEAARGDSESDGVRDFKLRQHSIKLHSIVRCVDPGQALSVPTEESHVQKIFGVGCE